MHIQDVIEVENTVSPQMLVGAPKDRPKNDWPVFRCSAPGVYTFVGDGTCDARPLAKRGELKMTRRNVYMVFIVVVAMVEFSGR